MRTFGILLLGMITGCAGGLTPSPRGIAESGAAVDDRPLICNVRDFGAKGDGVTDDTDAIQAAVGSCQGRNGTILFPSGKYMSRTITLGSRMTLHLDDGAILKGVRGGDESYPTLHPVTKNNQLLNCQKALIYSESAVDLTIEGPGIIDGNGGWSAWDKDKNGVDVKEALRPMAIFIVQSTNLVIRNVRVQNSPMWTVVLMETKHTRVDGLTVDSRNGHTLDGIDLVDGDDIVIDHSSIFSEDDAFCLKSGLSNDGLQNVTIQNSHVVRSLVANGLKFGTASFGFLRNIKFENILIEHVDKAAMAIESVDGSIISNVTFRNIKFQDVGTPFFVLLGLRGAQKERHAGDVNGISFENISGNGTRHFWGSPISGTVVDGHRFSLKNINFKNVHVGVNGDAQYVSGRIPRDPPEYASLNPNQYPDPNLWGDLPSFGIYFRHVDNVNLDNVKITLLNPGDQRRTMPEHGGKSAFSLP